MARPRCALHRVIAAAVVLVLAACGGLRAGQPTEGPPSEDSGVVPVLHGEVVVLAAASLAGVAEALADAFEQAYPTVRVELSLDGSARLATQLVEGAPADVFVAADLESAERVRDARPKASEATPVATSSLAIVVGPGNPLGVSGLADLGGGLRLALCAPEVPCGRYADRAFERAGLRRPSASAEESVQGVLTKVRLGEADAGVVYVTDVRRVADLAGVDLPEEHQVRARYLALALADGENAAAGAAFVEFLTSPAAQAILRGAGFGPP